MDFTPYAKVLAIPADSLSLVGEGDNGAVLTDGTGIAYKFPKHRAALVQLRREVTAMDGIRASLTFSVPEYIEVSLDKPVGEAYCSYKLLRGERLTREIYARHREALAKQLLRLQDEIHGMDPSGITNAPTDFAAMYQEIQKLLYPFLSDGPKEVIDARFQEYLRKQIGNFDGTCVVHGDFGASNILCNRETGCITGVIDWAEIAVDDPAIDYSALTCPMSIPECREDLMALRPSLSEVFERSGFIQFTFPLQEALHGIHNHDPEALQSGLEVIQSLK